MRKRAFALLGLLLAQIVVIIVIFSLNIPLGWGIAVTALGVVGIVAYVVTPYIPPLWVKGVLRSGEQATAEVLAHEPYMKGIGGYQGGDFWLELPVRVQPGDGPVYESRMKCRLSQYAFGAIRAGSRVPVRVDPNNGRRVVLEGDAEALLRTRLER